MIIWDKEVKEKISGLHLTLGIIKNVKVTSSTDKNKEIYNRVVFMIKEKFNLENLKNDHIIRAYRDFYWHYLKIDPTKVRPAGEALIRRILSGKSIPNISNVVDAYNTASIETRISLGAYNYELLKFPLHVRFAKSGEKFKPIGKNVIQLTGRELVLADQEKIICLYPHRDSDDTKVDLNTRNVLIVGYGVPNIDSEIVFDAVKIACNYILEVAGGTVEKIEKYTI
ncbi:MAG: B3/B4 domain-containing protein [Candidatus Baldrarchaeia archaeon]